MTHVISVAPIEGGWAVDAGRLAERQLFKSGGKAEDAAKRLALAVAKVGDWAEVRIYAPDGPLLGRFVCPPEDLSLSASGPLPLPARDYQSLRRRERAARRDAPTAEPA